MSNQIKILSTEHRAQSTEHSVQKMDIDLASKIEIRQALVYGCVWI